LINYNILLWIVLSISMTTAYMIMLSLVGKNKQNRVQSITATQQIKLADEHVIEHPTPDIPIQVINKPPQQTQPTQQTKEDKLKVEKKLEEMEKKLEQLMRSLKSQTEEKKEEEEEAKLIEDKLVVETRPRAGDEILKNAQELREEIRRMAQLLKK